MRGCPARDSGPDMLHSGRRDTAVRLPETIKVYHYQYRLLRWPPWQIIGEITGDISKIITANDSAACFAAAQIL